MTVAGGQGLIGGKGEVPLSDVWGSYAQTDTTENVTFVTPSAGDHKLSKGNKDYVLKKLKFNKNAFQ